MKIHFLPKLTMIVMCLFYGLLAGILVGILINKNYNGSRREIVIGITGSVVGLAIAILSAWIAAKIVGFCERLKTWAYKGDTSYSWGVNYKVVFGAFWPLTLIFSVILYIFLGNNT